MKEVWPALPYADWKDTKYALHMWTQVIGKIRTTLTPLLNQWWNSTLQVTPRGLTTALIPSGNDAFQIDLDLVAHELVIVTSGGGRSTFALGPMSVADFYRRVIDALARLGVPDPGISVVPSEVASAIPFPEDREVRPYDREMVRRFQTILMRTAFVFERFRADFLGKSSPVHFFWGGSDLGIARFSGRRAPAYTGGTPPHLHVHVMHEAYAHELIEAGFWAGNDDVPQPELYAFPIPAQPALAKATIRPDAAAWVDARGEFILPYEAVRTAADPAAAILEFLRSTYEVAADGAGWDRAFLEERPVCDCDPVPEFARAVDPSHRLAPAGKRGPSGAP